MCKSRIPITIIQKHYKHVGSHFGRSGRPGRAMGGRWADQGRITARTDSEPNGFGFCPCPFGPFWKLLGPSCAILGVSWGYLGPSWGSFGAMFGDLGAFLGRLGAPLGSSWAILALSWAVLGCLCSLSSFFGQAECAKRLN